MEINFTNVNFEKDISLPENIQTLNNDIKKYVMNFQHLILLRMLVY